MTCLEYCQGEAKAALSTVVRESRSSRRAGRRFRFPNKGKVGRGRLGKRRRTATSLKEAKPQRCRCGRSQVSNNIQLIWVRLRLWKASWLDSHSVSSTGVAGYPSATASNRIQATPGKSGGAARV